MIKKNIIDKLKTSIIGKAIFYLKNYCNGNGQKSEQYEFYFSHSDINDYFDRICKWEKRRNKKYFISNKVIKKQLIQKSSNREYDKKTIAFVVEHFSPRLLKLTRALTDKGYNVEGYVFINAINHSMVRKDFESLLSAIHVYTCPGMLMQQLIHSNAFVVHYFMDWLDAGYACVLLQHKELFPPIAVEHYDVLNGCYKKIENKYKEREKYVFEHANGVIFRTYTKDYLVRTLKIKISKSICFLDYIADISNHVANSEEKKDLSLVYVGTIRHDKLNNPYSCYHEFAKKCKDNHCHLHIYPNVWYENEYKPFVCEMSDNCFFHIHMPVEYSKLISEIERFDYGLDLSKDYYRFEDSLYYKEQYIYSSGNKLFDYLNAGLPVVGCAHEKAIKELEKDGVAVYQTFDEFDFNMLREKKAELKQRVTNKKNKYTLDEQLFRIEEFYRGL